jgi:hypothetical protein
VKNTCVLHRADDHFHQIVPWIFSPIFSIYPV